MIEHILFQGGGFDLALIFLGFGAGLLSQFRLPISLTIFMIRIIKWWFETHPHGQEVRAKTGFYEEFDHLFGTHFHEQDGNIPAEPIDNQ